LGRCAWRIGATFDSIADIGLPAQEVIMTSALYQQIGLTLR
jgi:hypothetical protein